MATAKKPAASKPAESVKVTGRDGVTKSLKAKGYSVESWDSTDETQVYFRVNKGEHNRLLGIDVDHLENDTLAKALVTRLTNDPVN